MAQRCAESRPSFRNACKCFPMKETHDTARTDNNRYNTSNSRSGTGRRYTRAYGVAVVSMMMMDEFYYEGFSPQRRKRCKTNGRRRDGKMTMTMTKKTVKKSGGACLLFACAIFLQRDGGGAMEEEGGKEEKESSRGRHDGGMETFVNSKSISTRTFGAT